MRFQFYSAALDDVPKLSVDGTVPNSIHFSHWEGNTTPAEVKADTSTEMTLNLVASPNRAALTNNIELVTNNHFDTDGVLSVWTMLNGERALEFRDLLISAAEAGDFCEHTSDAGVKVSIAIQDSDQANENTDERNYELMLPEVERLLTNIDSYEDRWRDGWNDVAATFESFARGESRVLEDQESRISLITLANDSFNPCYAISKHARGELFLIATPTNGGWRYRLDYPYYSWAETVVRPHIARRDLTGALAMLNEKEAGNGRWQTDNREMTSAARFLDASGMLAVSRLEPDDVLAMLQLSASRVAASVV